MEEFIGKKKFNNIIYRLVENQFRIKHKTYGSKIPLTGNFIDCRGTMVNWCPIGRNANHSDRALWVELDNKFNIRKNILDAYFRDPIYEGIEVKLGGSTSFDIFPVGWDKTYVMTHLKDYKEIYFFGDRCEARGNDKELYDLLKTMNNCNAYKTTGPEDTVALIKGFMEKNND